MLDRLIDVPCTVRVGWVHGRQLSWHGFTRNEPIKLSIRTRCSATGAPRTAIVPNDLHHESRPPSLPRSHTHATVYIYAVYTQSPRPPASRTYISLITCFSELLLARNRTHQQKTLKLLRTDAVLYTTVGISLNELGGLVSK